MSSRPTAAGPTRRQWIFLVCLFLVSLPAVTARLYSSDEIQYFAFLRSFWFDHDLSFENEYRYFYDRNIARSDGFHETFLERQTDTGRRINFGTIGCAMLWTPFYGVGHLAAVASGAPRDGFSKPYMAAVAYGSAFYGFLAIVLAVLCARRLGLNGTAAAVAVWLGTPLLFYMYLAPPFSHACSAFAVALFTYVWLGARQTWSPGAMAALGAAGALMAMTREQDVFFAVAPALDWALSRGERTEAAGAGRWWMAARGPLAAAACFLLVYSPQLATYKILNGHFGPHASVANKMKWYAPHALQVLLSPEHGFFVWTPLAAVALFGLFRVRAADPPQAGTSAGRRSTDARPFLLMAMMALLQVYVGGSVDSWTVAGGFGQRRFVALTTVMVIGLSSLLAAKRGRRVVATLAAFAVYWNVALTAEFATGLMDRQRLDPARNAYDAFVTVPRLAPALAYRYLFDRQSFYRAHPLSR